ncbi:MAG: hypothetical protein COW33_06395 [Anaerolineae bacterium CG17_big_fil_post_rev_8_21_14_2_50_57_27]|nr:MAG: hypothetical protein COW33_06395 [Anaerolineae bacterium CG17_big_fil_post_rev_8_21_14_2_50_57_27]PJH74694.1 MAG: hypothetical protein CO064_10670 [Anaerolineae bacterium CG_4_9_14_0_8_um_filter_58_9]
MDTALTTLQGIWVAYRRMTALLNNLPPYTRNIVEHILDEGVTREIVHLADEAPEAEWQRYQLLRMIVGANPEHPEYVTDLVLDEIRLGLESGELP